MQVDTLADENDVPYLFVKRKLKSGHGYKTDIIIIIIIFIFIIIIIIIIVISFMQGIYTYIPETNHISREYRVSAILSLLFMVPKSLVPALALLYFYVSTFRSMCAEPNSSHK